MDKSVVVFSLLSWESKLLHRGHMLAKYFALKGYNVYYVQKENVSNPKDLSFKPKYYEDKGIKIVSLLAFPYMKGKLKAIYTLNDFVLTKQVKDLFSKLINPLILIQSPNWIRAVNQGRDMKGILCYDISDDFLQFTTNERWKNNLAIYERETINSSDFIFVTAESLRAKAKNKKSKTFLVENGIDINQFKDSKNILDNYKRPICGFIGGLFEWIDYELIENLAQRHHDYSFVLIGPTDQLEKINKLCKNENVYYLGEKDKGEIGDYFASLDIGLIPFVSEEEYPRLKTVNSNKIFQYCYFGYPVVSSKFQQVTELNDFIIVSQNKKDFINSVGKALEEDSLNNQNKRMQFAYDNSWAKRVDEIIQIVSKK